MPAPVPRVKVICKECSQPFFAIAMRNRKFCSGKCARGRSPSQETRDKIAKKLNTSIKRTCHECRKHFFIWPSHLKKGGRTGYFCSRKCSGKNRYRPGKGRYIHSSGYAYIRSIIGNKSMHVAEHMKVVEIFISTSAHASYHHALKRKEIEPILESNLHKFVQGP